MSVTNNRRNEYRDLDPSIVSGYLDGRSITTIERFSTGKANTNFKLILSDGQAVVVRLFSESNQSSPARELKIAELVGDSVPNPKMFDHGKDWAVYEFMEGEPLIGHQEYAHVAAAAIAQLSRIRLPKTGWITETGSVQPFEFGDDYFGVIMANEEVRSWLGQDRLVMFKSILANEAGRLAEMHTQPSLVHGDFNPTNVLVSDGELTALLDWEWSHAGTPYMDIGNLLRNIDRKHHHLIQRGLLDGGFDLPQDWKERATLIDLASHLEFLSSSHSDDFKRTRIDLVDSFVSSAIR